MSDTAAVSETDLAILNAFHGHVGPYVVAGLRCGRFAVDRLQAQPHFGVEVVVQCPGAPPPSCFIDGIQISTGCTMGKMNIRHELSDEIVARFRNKRTGATLVLRLRPEPVARAVEIMHQQDDRAGAAVILSFTDQELLEEMPD